MSSSPLRIPKFLQTFSKLSPKQMDSYLRSGFNELQTRERTRLKDINDPSKRFSICDGMAASVQNKNRYCDILPFDYNRVRLFQIESGPEEGRDYINASLVEGVSGSGKKYILSQGPLSNTVVDFWKMVLQQHVHVIVCLTKLVEQNKEKCAVYWPDKQGVVDKFSDGYGTIINIEILGERVNEEAGCIERKLRVVEADEIGKEGWIVTQLYYLNWPDHNVPESIDQILKLVKFSNEVRDSYGASPEESPILVHCSAGCGRTGTFCVIDTGLALLEAMKIGKIPDDGKDLVFQMIDAFREQRITMVQTQRQYTFCYQVLLTAAEKTIS